MALVDQVFDLQAAERDAFAGFTDMGDRFGGRPFPLGNGRFLDGEGFQGAGDNLFGRVIPAGEQVGHHELLTVRVERQGKGHDSVYPETKRHHAAPARLPRSPVLPFFSSSFQSFPGPKTGILPAPMLTSNRRDVYPTQTPRPPLPSMPSLPPNPWPITPPEASARSTGLRHKISRHPRNPKRKRDLPAYEKYPQLSKFASQGPRPHPRAPPPRDSAFSTVIL